MEETPTTETPAVEGETPVTEETPAAEPAEENAEEVTPAA